MNQVSAHPTLRSAGAGAASRDGTWRPGLLIAVMFAGSTLLTPLYPAYQQTFHLSPLALTLVYGAYVIGNLSALLLFGRISDRIGRRPVALAAIAIAAVSSLAFFVAPGPWTLAAARTLSGVGVGIGAGAGAAWLAEAARRRGRGDLAALLTTVVNFLGLAAGPALAGLLAQFAPEPMKLPFAAYMFVLAATAWVVWRGAETVGARGRLDLAVLKPRLGVPADLRARFATPAIALFVSMAMVGFYAALAPGVTAKILHGLSPAISAGVVAEFCLVTTAAIVASRRLSGRTATLVGLALIPPGLALLAAAGVLRSLPAQALGAAVGGVAVALAYRGSLQAINAMAPKDRRAELVSAYFACGFLGNSVPVIGVGALTAPLGAETAGVVFAVTLSVLALAALAWGLAHKPTRPGDRNNG